jgi:hypothetical protein
MVLHKELELDEIGMHKQWENRGNNNMHKELEKL